MLDFPANPTPGQIFTSSGVTWTWDGVKWTAGTTGGTFVPIAGASMTGPLVLSGDPTVSLGAASKQYVDNSSFVRLSGSTMTGLLLLSADPGTSLGAATKQYVDTNATFIGEIKCFAGATAPSNWMLCNGASLLRSSFPALFAVIGTVYGSVDSTHFNIPNLIDRVAVGTGASFALGDIGGEGYHALTVAEMPVHNHVSPAHSHTITDSGHAHDSGWANSGLNGVGNFQPGLPQPGSGLRNTLAAVTGITGTNAAAATINNSGGNAPHNNMQPYLALNFIIRTQ